MEPSDGFLSHLRKSTMICKTLFQDKTRGSAKQKERK
jgi:hypothetical protein